MSFPINQPSGMEGYGGIDEVYKLLKKENKKGEKKSKNLSNVIKEFHIAHDKVKEAIADALKEDGLTTPSNSEMVDELIFALSLDKIFEKDQNGQERLREKLKKSLQIHDSESPEARMAVADQLSEGSKEKVPTNAKVVQKDIDTISMKTVEDPTLLFDGM